MGNRALGLIYPKSNVAWRPIESGHAADVMQEANTHQVDSSPHRRVGPWKMTALKSFYVNLTLSESRNGCKRVHE